VATYVVFASYAIAGVAGLLLLYLFEPVRWYWHVLSIAAALAVGLAPTPASLNTPGWTLFVGSVFILLMTWGLFAPLFRRRGSH